MLDLYRRWISPLLHSVSGVSGACRFQPTCSEYVVVAMSHHGIFYGAALSLWRLLRCNPFARGGFDPVPGTYPVAPLPLPSPVFLWSFVGSLNFMRPSLRERRTRGHVQSCVQEIRGSRTDDPRHLP